MGNSTEGLAGIELRLVDNLEEAMAFKRWIGERRPHNAVSVDIETGEKPGNPKEDAFSPWHGQIRLAQVGDGMSGWAIPWEDWKGVFYEVMNPYEGHLIFHNIAFEAKWFEVASNWKLPWHNSDDTMLMAQVINPLGAAGLKPLSAQMVDAQAASLQEGLEEAKAKNGWTWGTIPVNFQAYWAYGALDTILTTRIWEQFREKCGPGKAYSVPYELELAARRICTRMEINGAPVDVEYSQRKLDELLHYTNNLKQWMADNYGGTNIASGQQLVRLFESLGAEITEYTASGQKSMTKDQLDLLVINGSPEVKHVAELVLNQRKADKLASSYFSNFVDKNIDGVLHPSIRTMGARTGRMSITDPALQTLPSGDTSVRKAFIPKQDDWGIFSSDLDQVEFRLTANLSQDEKLIRLFHEADATGGDVFTSIMRQVYHDDTLQKKDPRRRLIKGVVYGKLYGAGVDKMALTAGVTSFDMKEVVDAFDANYPGVKTLQKQIENVGMQRYKAEGEAYVLTRTGRRLPSDANRVYSLTNYLIQATAAEIFKQNLIKLDQADLTEYLIVPVHDEIVLQAPKEDAPEIRQAVQEAMTTADGWAVPLTSGIEGPWPTWGDVPK